MKIEILCSFKNYVVIKDLVTDYVWLYSYNKPIAYWNGCKVCNYIKEMDLTHTNKKHIGVFREMFKYD